MSEESSLISLYNDEDITNFQKESSQQNEQLDQKSLHLHFCGQCNQNFEKEVSFEKHILELHDSFMPANSIYNSQKIEKEIKLEDFKQLNYQINKIQQYVLTYSRNFCQGCNKDIYTDEKYMNDIKFALHFYQYHDNFIIKGSILNGFTFTEDIYADKRVFFTQMREFQKIKLKLNEVKRLEYILKSKYVQYCVPCKQNFKITKFDFKNHFKDFHGFQDVYHYFQFLPPHQQTIINSARIMKKDYYLSLSQDEKNQISEKEKQYLIDINFDSTILDYIGMDFDCQPKDFDPKLYEAVQRIMKTGIFIKEDSSLIQFSFKKPILINNKNLILLNENVNKWHVNRLRNIFLDNMHINSKDAIKISCSICQKQFKNQKELINHQNSQHNFIQAQKISNAQCEICHLEIQKGAEGVLLLCCVKFFHQRCFKKIKINKNSEICWEYCIFHEEKNPNQKLKKEFFQFQIY